MFPDKEKTTYSLLVKQDEKKKPPKIIFGTKALKWIKAIVEAHHEEVGFYSVVDEIDKYKFFIRDVFYPKHSEMNAATCEISPEGENDLITWLVDNGKVDDVEKIKLWGHSHHNMSTSPSGQDEKQAIDRIRSTKSYLIRIICNKKGEISCSFFDYENGIRFDHIKWEIQNDSRIDEEKIEEINAVMSASPDRFTAQERVSEIQSIINEDHEYDSILEKVKELKKVNEPLNKFTPNLYKVKKSKKKSFFPYSHNHTDDYDEYGGFDDDLPFYMNIDKDDSSDERMGINDQLEKEAEGFEEGFGITK